MHGTRAGIQVADKSELVDKSKTTVSTTLQYAYISTFPTPAVNLAP
jgi:hypothetical protein